MTTITVNVDTETEQEFRKIAKKTYKGKKGFLGGAITEAMKKWVNEKTQREIAQKAIEDMRKGHKFGKILYTKREELYDRFDRSR